LAAGAAGFADGAFGALGALVFCAIATLGNAISASNTKIRCTIAMLFLGFISLPPDSPAVLVGVALGPKNRRNDSYLHCVNLCDRPS
jgi:hypothetical protein